MKHEVDQMTEAELCMNTCMNVRAGELVVLIADPQHRRFADALATASHSRGAMPVVITLPERQLYFKDPPATVAAAMKEADAIVLALPPEHGCQMWHTPAREAASRAGARIGLYFPPASWEISEDDLLKTKLLTDRLAALLDAADTAHITTPRGTDLFLQIGGRRGYSCASILREPGATATIPDWGDAEVSPVEATTNGTLVVDGSMTFIGRIERPIRIEVENGRAIDITGGREAQRLREVLAEADGNALNIAEFGIGTVPRGTITGHKDDKLLGTAHVALGHNVSLGGRVESNVHLDGVILRPTIVLDGQTIMRAGEFEEGIMKEEQHAE